LRAITDLIIGVLSAGNLQNVPSDNKIRRHIKQDQRESIQEIPRLGKARFMSHDTLLFFLQEQLVPTVDHKLASYQGNQRISKDGFHPRQSWCLKGGL